MAVQPKRSLLSKVVGLVTVAYFAIVVAALLPLAILFRDRLLEDRAVALTECAETGRTALDEYLNKPQANATGLAAGPVLLSNAPEVTAYIFAQGDGDARILGFTRFRELAPVNEKPKAGVSQRVNAFIADPSRERLASRIDNELVYLEKVRGPGPGSDLVGVQYFAIAVNDVEERVFNFTAVSFASGLVACFLFGLVTVIYLRSAFLRPLGVIIDADNAGRRGDFDGALINDDRVPDDELGTIMHSRNLLLMQQQSYRESLDAKNAELSRQREALRRWGRELEKVVRRKSEELVSARERLFEQEKLAALGRLAANVAHEINNPLASIAGYAEEMRDILDEREGGVPDDLAIMTDALRIIDDQAFRCKAILKRLLGLARSDNLKVERVDVGRLVRETVRMTEPSARRLDAEIDVRTPTRDGPFVETDPSGLVQVVMNLIENAIDAADAARGTRGSRNRVEVSVGTRGRPSDGGSEDVVLRVLDNGYGIPEDQREKIFDEFYTTKPIGRGTGLGLAICQSMTERLGGRIEVESLDGAGAAFSVVLPIKTRIASNDDDAAHDPALQFQETAGIVAPAFEDEG